MSDTRSSEPWPDDIEELVLGCLEAAEPRAELERRTAGNSQRFEAAWQLMQQVQRLERLDPDGLAVRRDPDPDDRATWPVIPGATLETLIGRGGQGFVFRARQTYLDRVVAVKVLAAAWHSPAFLVRFQREAQTLAGLQHPNIVTCHHAGLTEQGGCYLVMEFVEGPNLGQWLAQHGKMPLAAALRLALHMANALEHARQFGFVHRDVKPENVLLQPKPEASPQDPFPFVPKLADVGLARPVRSGRGFTMLTPVGAVLGTPLTMAPEQFDDPEHVDERADIYGLGCVLHHALAGRPAFVGTLMTDLMVQKSRMRGAGLHVRLRDVPAPVASLVARMIACDPRDRPQSHAELIEELEQSLRLATHRGARRRSIAGGATLLLLTAAAGAFFLRGGAPAEPTDDARPLVVERNLFGAAGEPMSGWACVAAEDWSNESDGCVVVNSERRASTATYVLPSGRFVLRGLVELRARRDSKRAEGVPIGATGFRILFGSGDRLELDVTPAAGTVDRFRAMLRRQRIGSSGSWEGRGDLATAEGAWSVDHPLEFTLRWAGGRVECDLGTYGDPKPAGSATARPVADWQVTSPPAALVLYAEDAVAVFTDWKLTTVD